MAGPTLTLTLDVFEARGVRGGGAAGAAGGSVAVGAYVGGRQVAGLSLADCDARFANTTNGRVSFKSGADFGHLLGRYHNSSRDL